MSRKACAALVLLLFPRVGTGADAPPGAPLDIAPFAQLSVWDGANPRRLSGPGETPGVRNTGLEWDEERDIRELRVRYKAHAPTGVRVEYWFKNWPYDPPHMPSFEDPMDDPWQGEWLNALVVESCKGLDCAYRFQPIAEAENKRARNLPGVDYRRTLKVRLVFQSAVEGIESLRAFSGSKEKLIHLAVELDRGSLPKGASDGRVSVYNGRLNSVRPQARGLLLDVVAAKPDLPGSHDATVVTIRAADHTFSFKTDDLRHGPIVIPEFRARITDRETPARTAPPRKLRVRQRIPLEPEQTYERASREIPPLDPWDREGERVYLPLAPDSNWQKFAVAYGGDVFVSKNGIKAKGRERARLLWSGDRITWRVGTGTAPYYRDDRKAVVRKLDGYLPVITQRWEHEGLQYSEETFATFLRGPLSPEDPARDEETPAILMLRMTASNPFPTERDADFWLAVNSAGDLALAGNTVRGGGNVVAQLARPESSTAAVEGGLVHIRFPIRAGGSASVVFRLPCVSDLAGRDIEELDRLDFSSERMRVIDYWRGIVNASARFTVPEPKFNLLARSVVPQIHISTTKDPKTGLYMVPAASYYYDVFENESAYQILLLDTLGQFDTAGAYLETMMRLQGSKNFPGMHTGPDKGIFHGARIDSTYDYTAHGYGLDHGTVLWTLAQHYLYSRDRAWLEHAWPHMRRGIEWIEQQRESTKRSDILGNKVREYGLLPASQLEDNADWANWFSINAYAWAGMDRAAEALADIGHPEAKRIRDAADAYKADLRSAILRAIETAPVARMQDGTYEPYVPVVPNRRFRLFGPIRQAYYERYGQTGLKPLMRLAADRDTLCGAVVFLLLNVFSPDEPIANWILDDWEDNETLSSGMGMNIHGITDDRLWFSQGGMVFQANLVNPIQVYLRRHEAKAAIRNLYNDFVSCLYPDVNLFTEEYHQWRHGSGPFYKISDESRFVNRVRDALVFEDGNELWLASGAPSRWLASKEGIRVTALQTFFGPVSYSLHAGAREGVVKGVVDLPVRNAPARAWLAARTPSGRIRSVMVNGKPWTRIDRARSAVELPLDEGKLELEIQY
ncbi:MAG TPA: hypothetical protein VHD76_00660 [Bryobacteraceae bacterium]|nr:hypothetical protein [Bryobacteraceae bacterium]